MHSLRSRQTLILVGFFLLSGIAFFYSPESAEAQKKFARRECLDCHKKFEEKYFSKKFIHSLVKDRKCEECHLRHGIVPKLLMKKEGNQVCLGCHSREKL